MKNSEITIRHAETKDTQLFFPSGLSNTFRGWVAEYEGEPVAIVGITFEMGTPIMFSEMIRKDLPKKAIVRGAKMLMEKMSFNYPVYAEAKNEKFLEFLGFNVFEKKRKVYVWQIPQR